jgi:segregation and condensation protein B
MSLKTKLEALIMSSPQAVTVSAMHKVLSAENFTQKDINSALQELILEYKDRGVVLQEISSGFCFQTNHKYANLIANFLEEKPLRYSNAVLEVLAIIAYKQPVTRAAIEEIRGVPVGSSMISMLLERDLVNIAGRKDIPGKPFLYATTKYFLDYFNLVSLADLPRSDVLPKSE